MSTRTSSRLRRRAGTRRRMRMLEVSEVRGETAADPPWVGTGFVLLLTGIRQPFDDVPGQCEVVRADGGLDLAPVERGQVGQRDAGLLIERRELDRPQVLLDA